MAENSQEGARNRRVLSAERRLRILIAAAAAAAVGGPVRILEIRSAGGSGRAKWNRDVARNPRTLPKRRPAVPHAVQPTDEVELG